MTYRGHSLYRFEYLPAVLVPILMALIDSGIKSFGIILPIIGWVSLALSMNVMNDYFDRDRDTRITGRSLIVISVALMALGFYCLCSHSLLFALIYTLLMVAYNVSLKNVAIVENVLQTLAYIILPYYAFAANPNILTLLMMVFAFTAAELAHHIADREATFQLLKEKGALYATLFFSALFFLVCVMYLILGIHKFYAASAVIALGAIIYTTRTLRGLEKIEDWVKIKKLEIEMAKMLTVYLLIVWVWQI